MKRDVSTSTIGRDENQKFKMDAYMFERRLLFGCSLLIGLALILWLVAISTDHWIIISGKEGIYIPETRRYFLSSHSGLWRVCRYTTLPHAMPNTNVPRNFTSMALQSPNLISTARQNLLESDFIHEFLKIPLDLPLENFNDDARKKMFASWIISNTTDFTKLKESFHQLVVNKDFEQQPSPEKPIIVDPLKNPLEKFHRAWTNLEINGTSYNIIIPEVIQAAIFKNWKNYPSIPKLLWPYCKDLELSPIVIDNKSNILLLVPPIPPKKGNFHHGYEYSPNRRCKYIDMFPSKNVLQQDLSVDDEIMDYIRSQASFACITILIMLMGCVFSIYTFLNPRYMFKRLASGVHFISAATTMVVIQVLVASNDYTKTNLLYSFPEGATLQYGYGVYLAWFVFFSNLFASIMFMWYSGKKKGAKAPTDEIAMADEAIGLGR